MSKFGVKAEYFGFNNHGEIVGVALFLTKPIFMGFKYGYSPRE